MIKKNNINKASKIIKKGGIVAFPTETVYGLGADATNENAVKRIFIVKERPFGDPLIVHINSIKMLKKCILSINNVEKKMIKEFWPGPLTIIFRKNDIIPDIVTGSMKTVAIRMPENRTTLELIRQSNCPIAAPSANKFGKISPTDYKDVLTEFRDKIDFIVKGRATKYGIESTIVRVVDEKHIEILRPGPITKEKIEEKTGVSVRVFKEHSIQKLAPGNYKRHYSPKTKLRIIYNESQLSKFLKMKKKLAYITIKENLSNSDKFEKIIYLNPQLNLNLLSKKLYSIIRGIDILNLDYILVDAIEEKGIGLAIMDRLKRAAGK